jgi:hypothetical protein
MVRNAVKHVIMETLVTSQQHNVKSVLILVKLVVKIWISALLVFQALKIRIFLITNAKMFVLWDIM